MLEDLKKILGINNTDFDNYIEELILSAIEDLSSVGIAYTADSSLIKVAIQTYVKAQFDEHNRVELQNSYDIQKDNLRKKEDYQGESEDYVYDSIISA